MTGLVSFIFDCPGVSLVRLEKRREEFEIPCESCLVEPYAVAAIIPLDRIPELYELLNVRSARFVAFGRQILRLPVAPSGLDLPRIIGERFSYVAINSAS